MTNTVEEKEVRESASLFATVEEIRAAGYPHLDQQLVAEILSVQRKFVEDRVEATRRTSQVINRWVSEQLQHEGRS
ncbi:hypothetical protein [Streptomyces sp. NPDC001811]